MWKDRVKFESYKVMADPVALGTNNLPSTPRVGEKVNLEERSVAVEDSVLEGASEKRLNTTEKSVRVLEKPFV